MKVCEVCGEEIGKPDGDNCCEKCENETLTKVKKAARNKARRERDQVMRDCGMVKVRGAMGGVYYE